MAEGMYVCPACYGTWLPGDVERHAPGCSHHPDRRLFELERRVAELEKHGSIAEEFAGLCMKYGHSWERLLPQGVRPYCRRCGLETHS